MLNRPDEKIIELNQRYEDVRYAINKKKAGGSLSRLADLKSEYDDTFDRFFDQKKICIKYEEWNYEEDQRLFDKSNFELLQEFDDEDKEKYIQFYEEYLEELEWE